jgi:hypothetical protein
MRLDASLPLSAPATEKNFTTWQYDVGAKFAELAAIVCRGLIAYWDGKSTKAIAHEAGGLFADCVRLKMHIDNFDAIVRQHSVAILSAYVAAPPNPAVPDPEFITRLVEQTLVLLTNFIKEKTN